MTAYRPKNCVKSTTLNEELVIAMRERFKRGDTIVDIARDNGVGYETARKAISGVTWSWVGGAVAANWQEKEAQLNAQAKQFEEDFLKKFNLDGTLKEEPKVKVDSEFQNPEKKHDYY